MGPWVYKQLQWLPFGFGVFNLNYVFMFTYFVWQYLLDDCLISLCTVLKFCGVWLTCLKGFCNPWLLHQKPAHFLPEHRLISWGLATWPAFSVGLVIYIVLSVTYVRQGGLLLHLSVTYVRQGGLLLLVILPYPLMGFRCFDRLVSNVHPSRRNLVTCYFALST